MSDELIRVREFMQQHDCHFVCPDCGGAFWATRFFATPKEEGYCKTDGCKFTWPRSEDGEYFYVITKVNNAIKDQHRE